MPKVRIYCELCQPRREIKTKDSKYYGELVSLDEAKANLAITEGCGNVDPWIRNGSCVQFSAKDTPFVLLDAPDDFSAANLTVCSKCYQNKSSLRLKKNYVRQQARAAPNVAALDTEVVDLAGVDTATARDSKVAAGIRIAQQCQGINATNYLP